MSSKELVKNSFWTHIPTHCWDCGSPHKILKVKTMFDPFGSGKQVGYTVKVRCSKLFCTWRWVSAPAEYPVITNRKMAKIKETTPL